MSLSPPPTVADGGAPLPACGFPASWLNDLATLRLPSSNAFTASHSTLMPDGFSAQEVFDRLYLPAASVAMMAAYEKAVDFQLLPLSEPRALEPQVTEKSGEAYNNPAAMVEAVNAHNAWDKSTHFSFIERVKLLFGAINKQIKIEGWRCADVESRFMRYSSVADGGSCRIWKYGYVEETADGKVYVHEYIIAAYEMAMFRSVAEKQCRLSQAKYMDNFPSLVKNYKHAAVAPAVDASAVVLPGGEAQAATAASFA